MRPVNGVRAGSSSCRVHARMPKRKGHSKRESPRRARGGGEAENLFFSRVYVYAHRGIAVRLFIDYGRRESDDEKSPRGGILEALFTPGCIDASFRTGEKEISTRS